MYANGSYSLGREGWEGGREGGATSPGGLYTMYANGRYSHRFWGVGTERERQRQGQKQTERHKFRDRDIPGFSA